MTRLARAVALALSCISSAGFAWSPATMGIPSGGGGGGAAPPARDVVGLVAGSPDITVFAAQVDAVPNLFDRARAAGAARLALYRSVADLSNPSTPGLLTLMGHPFVVHLNIWEIDAPSSELPVECDPDWTVLACRTAIAAEVTTHLCPLLESGDVVLAGNEQDEMIEDTPSLIAAHTATVLAVKDAIEACVDGVRVGPVFGHEPGDDATIVAAWDSRFTILGLNSYQRTAAFVVTDEPSDLSRFQATRELALSLSPTSWAVPETGRPSSAACGSSLAEQAEWARAQREAALTSGALFVNAFIELDGVLPSGPGTPCFERATDLGGDPANDPSEDYICSSGHIDAAGNIKLAWGNWLP